MVHLLTIIRIKNKEDEKMKSIIANKKAICMVLYFFVVIISGVLQSILKPAYGQWTKHIIDSYLDGGRGLYVVDMNGDDTLDVVAAGLSADAVVWYENTFVVGVDNEMAMVPEKYALYQNYPNPFNPSTTIEFSLARSCDVTLTIYNILGQKVSLLVSEKLSAGKYKAQWIASDLAGGLYFCRLEAGEFSQTIKMVLLK